MGQKFGWNHMGKKFGWNHMGPKFGWEGLKALLHSWINKRIAWSMMSKRERPEHDGLKRKT